MFTVDICRDTNHILHPVKVVTPLDKLEHTFTTGTLTKRAETLPSRQPYPGPSLPLVSCSNTSLLPELMAGISRKSHLLIFPPMVKYLV